LVCAFIFCHLIGKLIALNYHAHLLYLPMYTSHRARILAGVTLTAAAALPLVLSNPALAGTKTFLQQNVLVSPDEFFVFDILADDFTTTIINTGFTNPGIVTPTDPFNSGATRTDSNPLLTSNSYTFTGYKIIDILNGKRYVNGVYTGDIQYKKPGGTNAEVDGVFNYAVGGGLYPTDLIAHARPDDLWNPGNEGLGFSSTPSLPSEDLDNYVSFGGFGFDVFENGVFDEPYQLFTVSSQPTAGPFNFLTPGDYAGCPGSCVGAKVNVPGPLPLLGAGAAFGFSRRLRRRIKQRHCLG
jgi:hypothetical protein